MKKVIMAMALGAGLLVQSASADALKNVLSKKLHSQDTMPGMVNLDALDAQPVKPKSRSKKAVVATVNGQKIIKKEADAYLSKRTKGQVTDFDLLPNKQRLALIKELSMPILLAEGAQKGLSQEEKDAVLSRAWMSKATAEANVTDAQIEAAYEKIKAQAKAQSALQQIPPLNAIKDRIKMQIVEQQVVGNLMKGAQVRVADGTDGIAGYVGMMAISVDSVNKALQAMTKGKMTWATLPEKDKPRVLQMVAPSQFIALAAKNDLSEDEKKNALANYWMQKNISQIVVTDKEANKRYEKIKKLQKKSKSKKPLPDYATLEKSLKMQIANEKFIQNLTKKAKIKLK
jgi:nitrogen regulatory protein PII